MAQADHQMYQTLRRGLPQSISDAVVWDTVKDWEGENVSLDTLRRYAHRLARERNARAWSLPVPGTQVNSATVAEQVAPSVRQIRRDVFGAEAVPFPDYPGAVAWLEDAAETDRPPPPDRPLDDASIAQHVHRAMDRLRRETGLPWTGPSIQAETLAYARPHEEWTYRIPVWPGRLQVLARGAKVIARATGVAEPRVVAHILSGYPLHRPLAQITTRPLMTTLPVLGQQWRTEVAITVHSPMLSEDAWRQIRRQVRDAWGLGRPKRLSEQAQEVFEVVQQLGGVPASPKGRAAFWEKVREELDKRGVRYANWRGVYKVYARNVHKVNGGGARPAR